jgi:lysyl-tRNA synthetase class 2
VKPGLDGWRPSCSTQVLHVRAEMLRAIREFFRDCGYLEVETPCLSRDIVLDAWLEPFAVDVRGLRWFLQTSPEAHMKRLLAAGVGSLFQISRVFRQNERGHQHNSEFTMIEWYGVGSTWLEQLEVTETLVRKATAAAAAVTGRDVADHWCREKFQQTPYAAAFQRTFGVNVFDCSGRQLMEAARHFGVPLPADLREDDIDDILNVMLASAIEPQLGGTSQGGRIRPEFLCDYPPAQAALAVVSESDPQVARRFELYVQGLELCNGYQELTDEPELRRRDAVQNRRRVGEKSPELPGATRLLEAMRCGLPPCSGVALGFDRLVMMAAERRDIRDVMPFPEDRA